MLHCLALGSIVYYALELVYMTLKREQQVEVLGNRVKLLEQELDNARTGSGEAAPTTSGETGKRRWWKLW